MMLCEIDFWKWIYDQRSSSRSEVVVKIQFASSRSKDQAKELDGSPGGPGMVEPPFGKQTAVKKLASCCPKAPVTYVLQPVGDCLVTKKQLQPTQPLCDQKLHFSVADQSATGRRQLFLKVGDQSATGRRLVGDWWAIDCQLIGNGLQLVGNWLATGRRQVGDELATDYCTNNLLCRCNHE